MTLRDYLEAHWGETIVDLPVISHLGTKGHTTLVKWSYYLDGTRDSEASWVSIAWDNGKISDQTIDLLTFVTIA